MYIGIDNKHHQAGFTGTHTQSSTSHNIDPDPRVFVYVCTRTDINCDLVIYYCLIRMAVVFADTHALPAVPILPWGFDWD